MCAALVCNPIGVLPSECALFLATVHLFARNYTAREENKGTTLFLHACGVLGLFLEAFDHNESVSFPPVGIGSEV